MSLDQHLTKLGERLDGSVKVGFMAGATYPDGTPVAAVAFWNEYGASGPPRPFFRNMIAKESDNWGDVLATQLKLGKSGEDALDSLGFDIATSLEQSIIDIDGPALSPVTLILRKRFWTNPEDITFEAVQNARARAAKGETGATGTQAKPLIWTGRMKEAVTWTLED